MQRLWPVGPSKQPAAGRLYYLRLSESPPSPRPAGGQASWDTHQGLHHVGFVVPQCFHDVEHVDDVLLLDHLTHAADGTEGSTAATPISRHRGKR